MERTLGGLAAAVLLVAVGPGCERGTSGLGPAPLSTDPLVFDDALGDGVDFQAFLDTKLNAIDFDGEQRRDGSASLRVTVPGPGDDTGTFAGGAFTASMERDLSGYNALTLWAKASREVTLNTAGLGNDNTGTSRFTAAWNGIPVSTSWTRVIIPIPLPEKLGAERGLFFFAEGFEDDEGFDLWLDEIRFDLLDEVSDPRPTLLPATRFAFVGQTLDLGDTRTTFDVDGTDQLVEHSPDYFTFESSDETVARVVDGQVEVVGVGTTRITAALGDVAAGGAVTVNTTAPPPTAAPLPTHAPGDVISLFSNAYENRPVDTWSTPWDSADLIDFAIDGDDVKAYANLSFAGVEFATSTIDASEMTHFRIDVWGPSGCPVCFIKLKLVDFGEDGRFGGGDDSESIELGKLIEPDKWVSFDIPLEEFTGLANRDHLAQLIILGDPTILYVDNVYFHR